MPYQADLRLTVTGGRSGTAVTEITGDLPVPVAPNLVLSGIRWANPASGGGPAVLSFEVDNAIEFLDDRVLLFTSVGRQERVFRYALRASTAGTFGVPPLEASSMYDPGFGARTAAATLEITP